MTPSNTELPRMLGRSPDRHKYYPNPRPPAKPRAEKPQRPKVRFISVIDGKVKHV